MAAIKLEQQQKQLRHINERDYYGKHITWNSKGDRIMVYWNFYASYFGVTMQNSAKKNMAFAWALYPHIPEFTFIKTASIRTHTNKGLDSTQRQIGSKTR